MTSLQDSIKLIREFNSRHQVVNKKNQGMMLSSEVGELNEEILRRNPEGIAEEIGDVLFVAYSIALLTNIDYEKVLYDTCIDNSRKNESKEGDKVTKEEEDDN